MIVQKHKKREKKQTGFDVSCKCLVSISMTNMILFCSFTKKKVLSQALSEDAAWDFLIIFENDFYSIFTILIFYDKFSFHW